MVRAILNFPVRVVLVRQQPFSVLQAMAGAEIPLIVEMSKAQEEAAATCGQHEVFSSNSVLLTGTLASTCRGTRRVTWLLDSGYVEGSNKLVLMWLR